MAVVGGDGIGSGSEGGAVPFFVHYLFDKRSMLHQLSEIFALFDLLVLKSSRCFLNHWLMLRMGSGFSYLHPPPAAEESHPFQTFNNVHVSNVKYQHLSVGYGAQQHFLAGKEKILL